MEETVPVRTLLPRLVRRPPADLAATLVAVGMVNCVVFLPVVRETVLRVPVVLAFVLFVPGYAVVSALFPERSRSDAVGVDPDGGAADRPRSWWGRIDGVDRVALSVALSVVVVPVVAFAMSVPRQAFHAGEVLVAVSIVTAVTTAIAARRRVLVPADERFRVPYREWMAVVRSAVFEPDTRAAAALNVALIGSVLLALGSVWFAAGVLPQDDEYSALSVLPADGEAIDPDERLLEIGPDERRSVVVAIENEEGRAVEYAVVALEQEVELVEGEARVAAQRELDRFEAQLDHGETWRRVHAISPTTTGGDVRIAWLLYVDGDVPDEPSLDSADYHVYVYTGDS